MPKKNFEDEFFEIFFLILFKTLSFCFDTITFEPFKSDEHFSKTISLIVPFFKKSLWSIPIGVTTDAIFLSNTLLASNLKKRPASRIFISLSFLEAATKKHAQINSWKVILFLLFTFSTSINKSWSLESDICLPYK